MLFSESFIFRTKKRNTGPGCMCLLSTNCWMTGRTRSLWVSKGTDKEGHQCLDTDSEGQHVCSDTNKEGHFVCSDTDTDVLRH